MLRFVRDMVECIRDKPSSFRDGIFFTAIVSVTMKR